MSEYVPFKPSAGERIAVAIMLAVGTLAATIIMLAIAGYAAHVALHEWGFVP